MEISIPANKSTSKRRFLDIYVDIDIDIDQAVNIDIEMKIETDNSRRERLEVRI